MDPKIHKGKTVWHDVNKGIGEFFFERADYFRNSPFQIDSETGEKQSFLEVRRRSVKVAIALKNIGVNSDDFVLIVTKNDLDSIVPWFAAVFLDTIVWALDSHQDVPDIDSAIALTKPKVIFAIDTALDTVERGLELANHNAEIFVFGKHEKYRTFNDIINAEYKEEKDFRPAKVDVKKTSFIFSSSGTTGAPKGVEINHFSFMHFHINTPLPELNENVAHPCLQRSGLNSTPAIWTTVSTCASGSPKFLINDIRPEKVLEKVSEYQVERIGTGSAALLLDVLERNPNHNYNLSKLKSISCYGNKLPLDVLIGLRKNIPNAKIFSLYGSTELGIITSFAMVSEDPEAYKKIDSIGVPIPNVEIKIVDVKTRELLGPNQQGEILVKTPFGLNGYFKKHEPLPFDEDGFFKTQDLGYYDEDGYFYFVERISSSFKTRVDYKTYLIYPSTIEEELLKHPCVKEVSVFDIPNPKIINEIACLLVLKENSKVSPKEILDFAKERLPETHFVSGGIKIVDKLPKNIREKVVKRKCRELFLSLN